MTIAEGEEEGGGEGGERRLIDLLASPQVSMNQISILVFPVFLCSYLFSHQRPNGCPRHWVTAHRAEDGPASHMAVTFLTNDVALEALVDVA